MHAPDLIRGVRRKAAAVGVALSVVAVGLAVTAGTASASCGKWQQDTLDYKSTTFRAYVSKEMTVSSSGSCHDVNVRLNSGYNSSWLQAWVVVRVKSGDSWSSSNLKGAWVHTDHGYHVVYPGLRNGTHFRIEVPSDYGSNVNVTVMT